MAAGQTFSTGEIVVHHTSRRVLRKGPAAMVNDRAATARYTPGEEIVNSITHGVGLLLAIAATAVLVTRAAAHGDPWQVVGCSVFGGSLIFLYTASTLYHSVSAPRAKKVLRALDHTAIFVLIAGTYTPFALVNLRGPWGWSLFVAIWCAAVVGMVSRLTFLHRWPAVTVVLYVLMGWAVVVVAQPFIEHVSTPGLVLLAAGGLAYTGGLAFYAWERLPYNHAIWHGFVLAGSTCHVFAVLVSVVH